MANASAKDLGLWARAGKFLRETWVELKKASWPTNEELTKNTLLVLVAVAVIAVWIGGLDTILGFISRKAGL